MTPLCVIAMGAVVVLTSCTSAPPQLQSLPLAAPQVQTSGEIAVVETWNPGMAFDCDTGQVWYANEIDLNTGTVTPVDGPYPCGSNVVWRFPVDKPVGVYAPGTERRMP